MNISSSEKSCGSMCKLSGSGFNHRDKERKIRIRPPRKNVSESDPLVKSQDPTLKKRRRIKIVELLTTAKIQFICVISLKTGPTCRLNHDPDPSPLIYGSGSGWATQVWSVVSEG